MIKSYKEPTRKIEGAKDVADLLNTSYHPTTHVQIQCQSMSSARPYIVALMRVVSKKETEKERKGSYNPPQKCIKEHHGPLAEHTYIYTLLNPSLGRISYLLASATISE